MTGGEYLDDGEGASREDAEERKVWQMLTKGVNAKLKTFNANITCQLNRVKKISDDLRTGTIQVDITSVNLSLKHVQQKMELEARMYCECLDAHFKSMVDKVAAQDLALLEAGIAELKQRIDYRIVEMERTASKLHLEVQEYEDKRRAEMEQKIHDDI